MAFLGIFLMNLIIFLIIVGTCTTISAALFIIAAVLKKRQLILKNQAAQMGDYNFKIKKTYIVLRVIGGVFAIPLTMVVGVIIYAIAAEQITQHTSLGYNALHLNTKQTEKILKRGVDPDFTEGSNKHAQNGENTLLYEMASGHYDEFIRSRESTEESKDINRQNQLEIVKLLLEYGADVNYARYDQYCPSKHTYIDQYSVYETTDKCGWTPLMGAVYNADFEMVKILVDNGADVNAVDYCGYNVIDIIADDLDDEQGYQMLMYFIDKGVDPACETNLRQTPVWLAFRKTTGSSTVKNDKILSELKKYENKKYDYEYDYDY